MRPGDVNISTSAELEPEESASLGLLPGVDGEGIYGCRWDSRNDFEGPPVDLGWIGEDSNGVWTTRHPSISLLSYPKLWDVVDRFRYGESEIQPGEYDRNSAYEMEARIVMLMAGSRALVSKMDRGGNN